MEQRGRFVLFTDRREMHALPAEDFFTGSTNDDWYIDTDRDVDDGRVYIGQKTFENLAALAGFVPADLSTMQAEIIQQLESNISELRTLLVRARNAAAGILDATKPEDVRPIGESALKQPRRKLESPVRTLGQESEPADESIAL